MRDHALIACSDGLITVSRCLKHMDMYMKNLKPFIFAAHSELIIEIPSIKKSHLYEAFSAFCGFKSYAAFKVVSDITVKDLELANKLCF